MDCVTKSDHLYKAVFSHFQQTSAGKSSVDNLPALHKTTKSIFMHVYICQELEETKTEQKGGHKHKSSGMEICLLNV